MGDRLKEKVALVSGAGSRGPGWGNGKATAVLFARELHNNVGIVEVGGPVETSEESWDRVNDINLKSMYLKRTRSCRG